MITLQPIDEHNVLEAFALDHKPEQGDFVADPAEILAFAYAHRRQRAVCWGIYEARRMVGLALLHDLEEEPACYHLMELLVNGPDQGKGYGSAALQLILAHCRREGKFPRVEVCVKQRNAAAIHVYEKAGFRDTGYIDPDTPDSLILACELPPKFHGGVDIRPTGEGTCVILLRDMAESDIEDYVRWFTAETEWMDWDAPWETGTSDETAERESWTAYYRKVKDRPDHALRWKFEIEADGVHIGWVSAYDDMEYFTPPEKDALAVGIDIPEPARRGRGAGTAALRQFMDYYRALGRTVLYTQTWSGNTPMLALAEKLGFREVFRAKGVREVRGQRYDAVTLRAEL